LTSRASPFRGREHYFGDLGCQLVQVSGYRISDAERFTVLSASYGEFDGGFLRGASVGHPVHFRLREHVPRYARQMPYDGNESQKNVFVCVTPQTFDAQGAGFDP
jgi:hypothetical protein